MSTHLKFKLHEPCAEDLDELAIKARRAFMFRAERAFHKAWQDAADWMKAGNTGKREVTVTVHVADIEFENLEQKVG